MNTVRALATIATIAFHIVQQNDEDSVSEETGQQGVLRLQAAANDVHNEIEQNGVTDDAWLELAGECESWLVAMENFAGDTDGSYTAAIYDAFAKAQNVPL